jgi:hypothetical protein
MTTQALPIVVATNGYGLRVTEVASGGMPVIQAANGRGLPVVIVATGGVPVTGSGTTG